MPTRDPLKNNEYVIRARAKLVAEGGMRLSNTMLHPEAASALRALVERGYAPSRTGAIERAVIEADARIGKRRKR